MAESTTLLSSSGSSNCSAGGSEGGADMTATERYLKLYEEKLKSKLGSQEAFDRYRQQLLQKEKEASDAGKTLDDIVDLEKLKGLPKEEIEKMWNQYNNSKERVSAVFSKVIYQKFYVRSTTFSKFIVPLPLEKGGVQMFYAQSQTSESQFSWIVTSLEEFKKKQSRARPYLVIKIQIDRVAAGRIPKRVVDLQPSSALDNDARLLLSRSRKQL